MREVAADHRPAAGRRQILRPINAGSRAQRRVALTFDDGPNDPHTLRIADILEAHGARGTFFLVGKAVAARPDIARELARRGHLIAAHSWSHSRLGVFTPGYPELARVQSTLHEHVGVRPAFYRPPYGVFTESMLATVAGEGMQTVNWDVSAHDWETNDSATIARRTLKRTKPGSIIVLHDGCEGDVTGDRSATVDALPAILAGLAQRGLRPVRLDALLGRPGYLAPAGGGVLAS
ncbi:MAG: polysaccharide deacetylase family protein [Burkholderiales bacterium]